MVKEPRDSYDNEKKLLICDFDGTLVDRNSEATFLRFLIDHHLLGGWRYFLAAISLPVNRISRSFGGNDILRAWSAFRSRDEIRQLITRFLEENDEIRVNEKALEIVRRYEAKKLLLTGSNQQLVERLLDKLGLSGLFDVVVGAEVRKNGFFVVRHPYGKSKKAFIDGICEVGLGNEYADRFFLSRCERAYAVCPDEKLRRYSEIKGWNIL